MSIVQETSHLKTQHLEFPRKKPGPFFDCATRTIRDATLLERLLIRAIQLGARSSSIWAYRGFGACCRVLQRLMPNRSLTLMLDSDAAFSFPFADGYWSMLLGGAEIYEPEIEEFLRIAAAEKYTLLDCGANYGYWSVLASASSFGAQRVIAFEPAATTFAILQDKAALNGNRFACIKKAVGAVAGFVRLSGNKHEARTVSSDVTAGSENVEMLALDNLLDVGEISPRERIVIKLDVEGQEIAALHGSARILAGDSIVICEDHGSDRNHTVSRYILEKTQLKLFCYDSENVSFVNITDTASLDRLKRFRNRGYNVFATASVFWEEKLITADRVSFKNSSSSDGNSQRSARSFTSSLVRGGFLY